MKKSNLIKTISILILSVTLIFMCSVVNADDNSGFNDISNTLTSSNNSSSNTNSSNTNSSNSANTNSNTNSSNTNRSNNTNNANTNSNRTYNNTSTSNNLPKTGVADSSLPIAALVVIFGVSAIYAYRKIKEYRNI